MDSNTRQFLQSLVDSLSEKIEELKERLRDDEGLSPEQVKFYSGTLAALREKRAEHRRTLRGE